MITSVQILCFCTPRQLISRGRKANKLHFMIWTLASTSSNMQTDFLVFFHITLAKSPLKISPNSEYNLVSSYKSWQDIWGHNRKKERQEQVYIDIDTIGTYQNIYTNYEGSQFSISSGREGGSYQLMWIKWEQLDRGSSLSGPVPCVIFLLHFPIHFITKYFIKSMPIRVWI